MIFVVGQMVFVVGQMIFVVRQMVFVVRQMIFVVGQLSVRVFLQTWLNLLIFPYETTTKKNNRRLIELRRKSPKLNQIKLSVYFP